MLTTVVLRLDSTSISPTMHSQPPSRQRIPSAAVPRISVRSLRLRIGKGSLRRVGITSSQIRKQEQLRRLFVDVLNQVAVREADRQPKFDQERFHPLRHQPNRLPLSLLEQNSQLKNGTRHSGLKHLRLRLHGTFPHL